MTDPTPDLEARRARIEALRAKSSTPGSGFAAAPRRRHHAALASRVLATGLAAGTAVGLIGVLAQADQASAGADQATVVTSPLPSLTTLPPTSTSAAGAPPSTATTAVPTTAPPAAAPPADAGTAAPAAPVPQTAPVTAPPVTAPPVTAPPVTAAPVTAPPAPPVTAPPVTAPPATSTGAS